CDNARNDCLPEPLKNIVGAFATTLHRSPPTNFSDVCTIRAACQFLSSPSGPAALPRSDIVGAGSGAGTVAGAIGVREQMFDADEQVLGQEQSDQKASSKLAKKGGFPMLSWANFYRGLANEATLRAAQMANSAEKDKLEEVAKEWSALAEWV